MAVHVWADRVVACDNTVLLAYFDDVTVGPLAAGQ